MEKIILRYLGHACFQLEYCGYSIVFDPYAKGSVPGLKPVRLEADLVLCSHNHNDHNAVSDITCSGRKIPGLGLEFIDVPHDEAGGALRGMNRISILTVGGFRVVHLGDIGLIPDDEILRELSQCDIMMVPVGGYYTLPASDAAKLIHIVNPRFSAIMHYRSARSGYPVLGTIDDFRQYAPVTELCQSKLEITKEDHDRNIKIIALKALNEE